MFDVNKNSGIHSLRLGNRSKTAKMSFILGFTLIMLMTAIITYASILFVFGMSLSIVIVPLAVITVLFLLSVITKHYFPEHIIKVFIIVLVVSGLIVMVCLMCSAYFYDLSWDGQEYHQTAVIKLMQGWNPLYESIPASIAKDDIVYDCVNHYPKAYWICAASLAKLTGNVETGKSFHGIIIMASFFLTLSFLLQLKKLRTSTAVLGSVLIAFNPVNIYQMFTYYVDGPLSSLMVALFAVSCLILLRIRNIWIYLLEAALIIIMVNTKFTGLAYAVVIVVGLFAGMWIVDKKLTGLVKPAIILGTAFIVAIVFFGAASYGKNLVTKGHPMYPVMGENKRDIMGKQYPRGFTYMNRFEKLVNSVFSYTDNTYIGNDKFKESYYKVPFSLRIGEARTMAQEDARVSGWGPLFGGALIVGALLMVFFTVYFIITKHYANLLLILLPGVWVLLTVISNSESWWARFAPQLWLLPCIAVILTEYYAHVLVRKKTVLVINSVLLAVLFANIALTAGSHFYIMPLINAKYKLQLQEMAQSDKPVKINLIRFETAFKEKFRHYGIRYEHVDEIDATICKKVDSFDVTYGEVKMGIPK